MAPSKKEEDSRKSGRKSSRRDEVPSSSSKRDQKDKREDQPSSNRKSGQIGSRKEEKTTHRPEKGPSRRPESAQRDQGGHLAASYPAQVLDPYAPPQSYAPDTSGYPQPRDYQHAETPPGQYPSLSYDGHGPYGPRPPDDPFYDLPTQRVPKTDRHPPKENSKDDGRRDRHPVGAGPDHLYSDHPGVPGAELYASPTGSDEQTGTDVDFNMDEVLLALDESRQTHFEERVHGGGESSDRRQTSHRHRQASLSPPGSITPTPSGPSSTLQGSAASAEFSASDLGSWPDVAQYPPHEDNNAAWNPAEYRNDPSQVKMADSGQSKGKGKAPQRTHVSKFPHASSASQSGPEALAGDHGTWDSSEFGAGDWYGDDGSGAMLPAPPSKKSNRSAEKETKATKGKGIKASQGGDNTLFDSQIGVQGEGVVPAPLSEQDLEPPDPRQTQMAPGAGGGSELDAYPEVPSGYDDTALAPPYAAPPEYGYYDQSEWYPRDDYEATPEHHSSSHREHRKKEKPGKKDPKNRKKG